MKKLIFISVFLAFSLTCFAQKGKWKKAQKINTIESYQGFIVKYPESEFSDDANIKLIELEFEKVKKENTIEAFTKFLAKYPQNKFATETKHCLEIFKKIEAHTIATISSYKIGQTTYSVFKHDLSSDSLELGGIHVKIFNPIETGEKLGYHVYEYKQDISGSFSVKNYDIKESRDIETGEKLGCHAIYIVNVPKSKYPYCRLTFKGEGKLVEALLTAIEFIK